MTHMLQGKRKKQAIKAMQRGTFMAYAAKERYRVDHPLSAYERMRRLLRRSIEMLTRSLTERLVPAMRKANHAMHTMVGSTPGSRMFWHNVGEGKECP